MDGWKRRLLETWKPFQNKFLTIHSFRNEAAKALVHLLNRPECQDCVIALSPSGLMGGYLRVIKKANGITDQAARIVKGAVEELDGNYVVIDF